MSAFVSWNSLGALVLGYLLGSIPFGLLLTRFAGLGDIRAIGSHSIGATNVLRTGRKELAAGTLLLDALKGTAAVLIAGAAWGPEAALVAGLGAFLGHIFPVWLGFNGGKGFATYLGVLIGLYWPALIVAGVVWLGTAAIFRFSSLAALTASVVTPVALFLFGQTDAAVLYLILLPLLWLRHHENIRRLLAGTETRIGEKR
jgi:glycerol-3-phosphate acyltransferase PlsY